MIWEEMSFEEFQDGLHGGHLEYPKGRILTILNLCPTVKPPSCFGSIRLVWEKMSFEEFQNGRHGGHLGYRNGTILAVLNLHVAKLPPIKFQLNPIYCSKDVENVKSKQQTDD